MVLPLKGLKGCGGETGIRTLDTLRYTRFPSVRLQPLGHLSAVLRASSNLTQLAPLPETCAKRLRSPAAAFTSSPTELPQLRSASQLQTTSAPPEHLAPGIVAASRDHPS